jgi:hypothetical protein
MRVSINASVDGCDGRSVRAVERRARPEGAWVGRGVRLERTREPGRARGGRYARAWASAVGELSARCAGGLFVDRKCSRFRAPPGSLSANRDIIIIFKQVRL